MNAWRRFQFFEKSLVKDEAGQPPEFLSRVSATTMTSGRGHIIVGDAQGLVHVVSRGFGARTFSGYDLRVVLAHQLRRRPVLVTVGDDAETVKATVKLWSVEALQAAAAAGGGPNAHLSPPDPVCLRSYKVFRKRQQEVPVTALAVTEDLSMLAVGLENGKVVLIRGDLVRAKNVVTTVLDPRVQHHADGGNGGPGAGNQGPSGDAGGIDGRHEAITGLGFRENDPSRRSYTLFAVTESAVAAFTLNQRGQDLETLEDQGCPDGCAIMSPDQELIVGRREAIYFFHENGKGKCVVVEGEKRSLSWFRNYLIVVGRDPHNPKLNTVAIYDLHNKFIAFSGSFANVTDVVCEWGSVYIFAEDEGGRKAYQLDERDTQTKLETLFRRNLYSIATALAQSQSYDPALMTDISRKHADHLLSKGDHKGAMREFIRTVGRLEPSYVIRKYLESTRIASLTEYLEVLHERGLAGPDHTTLLLNCLTKLKDTAKIDAFITSNGDHFEIQPAIVTLRAGGYSEHALLLAKRHREHLWAVKIMIEDTHAFGDALEYIATLDFFAAEACVKRYGNLLMNARPDETMVLIRELCTSYVPRGSGKDKNTVNAAAVLGADSDVGAQQKPTRASPEDFVSLFVNHPLALTQFLEAIVAQQPDCSPKLYETLLELLLREDGPQDKKKNSDPEALAVAKRMRRTKALSLLRSPTSRFDESQALALCHMHGFKEGTLDLLERMGLYSEILRYHMEGADPESDPCSRGAEVIRACKRFGDKDPGLWVDALTFFASDSGPGAGAEISEVLAAIERERLVPPLVVVQILARNPQLTLGVAKDFVSRCLREEADALAEDERSVRNYREETAAMKAEVEQLRGGARIFQLSKCSSCNSPLDLPAVHFLCMHSFHARCLQGGEEPPADRDRECPVCAPENREIAEIRGALENAAGQHDLFFKQLAGSKDGFKVVAEYFGRGIFKKVIMLD